MRGEAVGTSRKKEKPAKRKGGFQRVSTDSPPPEGDSDTDEEEALCADIPAGNGKTRGARNGKLNGKINGKHGAHTHDIPPVDDDESDARFRAGTRVHLHRLVGKKELNGQVGVVMGYDVEKQRYRVRVESAGEASAVMAFKAENLKR